MLLITNANNTAIHKVKKKILSSVYIPGGNYSKSLMSFLLNIQAFSFYTFAHTQTQPLQAFFSFLFFQPNWDCSIQTVLQLVFIT